MAECRSEQPSCLCMCALKLGWKASNSEVDGRKDHVVEHDREAAAQPLRFPAIIEANTWWVSQEEVTMGQIGRTEKKQGGRTHLEGRRGSPLYPYSSAYQAHFVHPKLAFLISTTLTSHSTEIGVRLFFSASIIPTVGSSRT
jgi:hypothetical protein